MSIEPSTGAWTPGTIGTAEHVGDPLTVEQINALEPGTRIVVTWSGGNGPWEGTVVLDPHFGVCYTNDRAAGPHPLLNWPDSQTRPLNRVTLATHPAEEGQE